MKKNSIGNFIIKLRKEKGMTQEDLAKLLSIGRETISKWERGIVLPNTLNIKKLSEIFNVSPAELVAGKRNIIKGNNKKEFILKKYIKEIKFGLKIVLILIILFLIFLFLYIHFNTYNTIKIYRVGGENGNIVITNGILVMTKDKIYFNLGDISFNEEVKYLKLYHLYNKEKLIYATDNNKIILYDYYGYNAYFDYDNIDNIIDNLYLEINSKYVVKLEVKKDFANDYNYFFNKKIPSEVIEDNNSLFYNSVIDVDKIKEKFKGENGIYTYEDKNYSFIFIEEHDLLNMTYKKDKISKEWSYYINTGYLSFNKYDNENLINSFNYDNSNIVCNDNCHKNREDVDIFFKEISKILN